MRAAISIAGLVAVLALCAADAPRAPIVRRGSPDAGAAAAAGPTGDAGLLDGGDGSLPPPPPPLPPKMAGVYNLKREDELDALNLELADTGWRFTLCGCDASRDRKGPVEVVGSKVKLLPPTGKADFPWLGMEKPVRDVEVTLAKDSSLEVVGKTGDAPFKPFKQKLARGRICAVCNLSDFPGFKPDPGLMEGMLILSGPRGLTSCPGPVPANPCDPR